MLENHLNAIEEMLCAQGRIAANAGHPNLIGNPKEWFIKDFLADHLPETVKIGQGEIINSKTKPKTPRNQVDIVLYHQDYPKISYSKYCDAFLIESVIATIEVKSKIDIKQFKEACKASSNLKNRQYIQEYDPIRPFLPVGIIEDFTLPTINSYLVAFDGPTNISTVAEWMPLVNYGFNSTPDKIIDMVIILGKGTIWRIDSFPPFGRQLKSNHPNGTWAFISQSNKNLLLLFLHMLFHMTAIGNVVLRYAMNVQMNNISIL